MNVALIGMPGTMKTTVGKALARLTGLTFTDSDDEFEREEGRTVADTFASCGEEYFRTRETEIIKRLASRDGLIISCGGGVPMREENVKALSARCVVVLLTATPEQIFERTGGRADRPLLAGGGVERVRELWEKRRDAYERAARLTLDTTSLSPEAAAEKIIGMTGLK